MTFERLTLARAREGRVRVHENRELHIVVEISPIQESGPKRPELLERFAIDKLALPLRQKLRVILRKIEG